MSVRFGDYPGHFPDHPLVPGAALLEAVAAALGLTNIERVRFLAVVRPGEDLELRVSPVPPGSVRFSLWRESTEVLRGIGTGCRGVTEA